MHVDFKATLCACSKTGKPAGDPKRRSNKFVCRDCIQVNLMTADFICLKLLFVTLWLQ